MDNLFFQWDYLSIGFEMEPDLFHTYLTTLEELGEKHLGREVWINGTKVRAMGAVDGAKRRYFFSAWGRAARIVQYLPVTWAPFVRRLDVKCWEAGLTGAQADTIGNTLLTSKPAYNITVINSKPRRKTDDRDAGGKGFAIGSHKSDLRVSSYTRGGAPYCLEFQCKGDMLDRILNNCLRDTMVRGDNLVFWSCVKEQIQACGGARYTRALSAAGIGQYVPVQQPNGVLDVLEELDRRDDFQERQERLDLDEHDGHDPVIQD